MIPNELMATKLVNKNAAMIYSVINSFTEQTKGKCFKGSNGYLALIIGLSEKTIKAQLKVLIAKEWVLSNGHRSERRTLQTVPVEEIDELQNEYSDTKKKLEALSKHFKENISPLEKWMEERRKERASNNPNFPVDGNIGTLQDPKGYHNETRDETNNETRNKTSNELVIPSSLSIPTFSEKTIESNNGFSIELTEEVSEDLNLLIKMLVDCEDNEDSLPQLFQKFKKSTSRRIVWFGELDNESPTGFYIDAKHPTEEQKFNRNEFLVIEGASVKEITNHYA